MSQRFANYQAALQNFRQARQQAALQQILARLTGRSNKLLSYDEVVRQLKLSARTERGIQTIPIDAIVGSVDRYADFTRTFLPRHDSDRERWARVKTVLADSAGQALEPIQVYKIGAVYFVSDGNHRVSIARQAGIQFIEAHVIEVATDIPLTPDIQPEDLIVKAEYADFLAETHLTQLRPNVDLSVTAPGQYQKLKQQIQAYQNCCGVAGTSAVEGWYDQIYTPLAEAIREQGLLRWFPNRTVTDLYLWVSEHREALEQELGWAVRPEAAVTDLIVREKPMAENAATSPQRWRQSKVVDRYTDRLFADILVPLTGTEAGWSALQQASIIARYDNAQVHGLHVVAGETQRHSAETSALQMQFAQHCRAAQIEAHLIIEIGEIAQKIFERALLTDLVVLHLAHPPAEGWSALRSGWQSIIRRTARPILAVPHEPTPLQRALVAFDGSPQAKQALFVAAYLAERWHTQLAIFTAPNPGIDLTTVQNYTRDYLELHEIQAEHIVMGGSLEALWRVVANRQIDVVLMGGYSTSPLGHVLFGSTVDSILRQAVCPLLICR